ncbi:tetratricopeptide repeat protein [Thalassotalea sp. ND16A]|uniref:tetratricopeptide repeat protein n=1 Tax=Thalassotalea sp. ND16A TaxID=1535422 RepID=UPI00051DECE1|nr:hypothetical protein [Thalassotalea sp. ND16A]KGJ92465.1 hypothetical protein ND16A_1643 [Thalassotalea sp. ND16A]
MSEKMSKKMSEKTTPRRNSVVTKVLVLPGVALTLLFASNNIFTGNSSLFNRAISAEPVTQKTKKVPAMRERVYSQLARAQKTADDGDIKAGLAILDEVKDRLTSLNSYERAMLFNFYAFIHYGNDNVVAAIDNFELVVKEQTGISDALYISTQFSLAQLFMQQQDYKRSEQALLAWQSANNKALTADQYVLFAQVYYQQQDFINSLMAIDNAIREQHKNGKVAKENWLILKRAAHYELQQPELVTAVLEDMVRLFNKPQYWLQLSAMYGEIGEEAKQLAVMEAAFQAGFVEQQDDIMTLAQLYIYHQLPYKSAVLMQQAMDVGRLTVNERRLELLAQAYMLAKEEHKALPVLQQASQISESGKFDAQLAQLYVNLEMWQKAIVSAEQAIARGNIDNPGDMHLAQGMSYFNLQQFEQSLIAFEHAQSIDESANMAKQWRSYVQREQGYQLQLVQLTDSE